MMMTPRCPSMLSSLAITRRRLAAVMSISSRNPSNQYHDRRSGASFFRSSTHQFEASSSSSYSARSHQNLSFSSLSSSSSRLTSSSSSSAGRMWSVWTTVMDPSPPLDTTTRQRVNSYYYAPSFSTTTATLTPPYVYSASAPSSSALHDNNESHLWRKLEIPKKGTGFDHFTPPKKGSAEENKKQDGKTDDDKNSSRGGGGGDSNNNDNNNRSSSSWEQWAAAMALVVALYMATSSTSTSHNNGNHDGEQDSGGRTGGTMANMMDREISWHDLLGLLQQQQVIKIVVTDNHQIARVYVRNPNTNSYSLNDGTIAGEGAVDFDAGHDNSQHDATSQQQQHQQHQHRMAASTANTAQNSSISNSSSNGRRLSYEEQRRQMSQQQQQQQQQQNQHQQHQQEQESFSASGSGSSDQHQQDQHHPSEPQQQQQQHWLETETLNRSHMVVPFYYRMQIGSIESFERRLDEAQRVLGRDPNQDVPVQYLPNNTLSAQMLSAVPGLVFALALYGMLRYAASGIGAGGLGGRGGGGGGGVGGIFQIGKSTAKKINKEDINVTFADVAGCDEAKREIVEFVDFLKDADRFTKLGAKIPKGALLCGPPGTGKTLLAKAVAGEAGVPFYSISGADFIEMFVGVGPSRVRDLFSEARQNAPCIIFIDEIDAVGRQRGRGGVGGNDERENTLNQLLVEMDGFDTTTGVVVLAGTNRADILDSALTRPGRFDRQITVDKPDLKGRKEIFKVHLKGITLDGDVDDFAGSLAGLTPGFAGADIANICNEAAIVAARREAEAVSIDDFEKATDRIIGGLESNKIMSKEERSIVAHHEAGHAVAGWFLEHADPLLKVTIIPRSSGALGFAQYLPKEVFLRTHAQIMDIVCMALAGRAAEEIFYGRVTTGASDDLRRVTNLVYQTIQIFGFNERLGQLSFPKDPNAMWDERPYSEKTARAMDEEARNIVDAAYERTLQLLRDKKTQVEQVAKMLLEKETITHDDVAEIIGARPFKPDPGYQEFIERKKKVLHPDETANEDGTGTTVVDENTLKPGLA